VRLFQKVGNVHGHGAGRTINGARHAVPTLVIGHVRFLGEVADPQNIEWTDIDAYRASLVGNTLVVINDDGDRCEALRQWHAEISVMLWVAI
jgi:hypothetical protein